MTIDEFVRVATAQLDQAGIKTARLDVLVLLSDEIRQDKAWILAHGDMELTPTQLSNLHSKLACREAREPLAYIRRIQEFFGYAFTVTPDVLIPRPETEMLVELLLDLPLGPKATVIDVGTGSGAIAISIKRARPDLHIYATDISDAALAVARRNAERLQAEIWFTKSDLLANVPTQEADCIIANLPYVDKSWQRSPETAFEPGLALFADNDGLELIARLIAQAAHFLKPGGYLLLEADPKQLEAIAIYAKANGFTTKHIQDYSLVFSR